MKSFSKTICTLFAGLALLLALCGCGVNVEASAKPLVEKILKDNTGVEVECERIEDIKEVSKDHYTGVAILKCKGETGRANVKMEVRGSQLYVEITKLY